MSDKGATRQRNANYLSPKPMSQSSRSKRLRKEKQSLEQSTLTAKITSLYPPHPFFARFPFPPLPPVNFKNVSSRLSQLFNLSSSASLLYAIHDSNNNNDDANCLKQSCTFTPSSARPLQSCYQFITSHRINLLYQHILKQSFLASRPARCRKPCGTQPSPSRRCLASSL